MKHKNVVFIIGLTGSGKTTTGKELANKLGCDFLEADKFYDFLGERYDIEDFARFCNPKHWGEIPTIREDRKEYYTEMTKELESKTLIIEGATPIYPEELEDILEVLKPEDILFIHLKPDNWEELTQKKFGISPDYKKGEEYFREVENNLKDYKVVEIRDVNYLSSPLIYQREGFTNVKWQRLSIGDLTGKSVLDLGCNSGWFSKYSFEQGAKAYTGVDNQIKEITYAKHLFDGEFIHQDIEEFLDKATEENKSYDVCIIASTLHYFDNKEEIVEKISKIAKEIVLEIPISQQGGAKEYPKEGKDYTIPTKELVFKWIEKHFDKCKLVGESVPPDNSYRLVFKGEKQNGKY